MDYPSDFPEHLKCKVDAAIAGAEVEYIDAKVRNPNTSEREILIQYIQTVFFGFANQCVQAGKEGHWSGERIRKAFREFLDVVCDRAFRDKHPSVLKDSTSRHQFRESVLQSSKHWENWREIHQGLAQVFSAATPTEPQISSLSGSVPICDEMVKRESLLTEYKAATGNPSNKRIYEARNSGIHKPEFYAWLRGKLPDQSATRANFERFLKDKKPPIPRK